MIGAIRDVGAYDEVIGLSEGVLRGVGWGCGVSLVRWHSSVHACVR